MDSEVLEVLGESNSLGLNLEKVCSEADERFSSAEVEKKSFEIVSSLGEKESKISVSSGSSTSFLIQTNITRFGSLIIMIFVVGLLMSLYRYCMRLSAFYDARADALRLHDKKGFYIDQFKKAADAMTPTTDFGKQPSHPSQHAVELTKELMKKSGK